MPSFCQLQFRLQTANLSQPRTPGRRQKPSSPARGGIRNLAILRRSRSCGKFSRQDLEEKIYLRRRRLALAARISWKNFSYVLPRGIPRPKNRICRRRRWLHTRYAACSPCTPNESHYVLGYRSLCSP